MEQDNHIPHCDIFDGLHPKPEDHPLNQQKVDTQKEVKPQAEQIAKNLVMPDNDFLHRLPPTDNIE